jgi:hypothetical protein
MVRDLCPSPFPVPGRLAKGGFEKEASGWNRFWSKAKGYTA